MMKKVIKKVVAKASVKKTVAKKPMMKYGGAKRTLRKYQGDEKGSAVGPGGGSAPAPKRSFADAYKANLDAGLRKGQARKIAMVETGIKEQKKRIDPNTVINAIGNTAGAVGSVANAFRKPVAGSTTSGPGVNPGSTSIGNQNPEMEFEKRGGAIKKKGGAMKKLGCAQCGKAMKKGGAVKKMAKGGSTLSGSAIKKAPTYMYGMPQENMGTSGQYGMMKKGGAKKSFPDMSGDGKVTAKDILMAKGVIKKPKAKFGATVKVQRSPKAGKVTAVGRGYAAVGKREPGRIIKKTISKKK